jgi:nucleotide-binding universal stress UspA family protein
LVNQTALEQNFFSRLGGKVLDLIIPDKLEAGPPPGQWRISSASRHAQNRLFAEILVPIDGKEGGWFALEQALVIAQRESSHLHGLFVVKDASRINSEKTARVRDGFNQRCDQAGIPHDLVVTMGLISQQICNRSAWADLVVVNVAHPPSRQILARLNSGFRDLITHCPAPILATPSTVSQLDRALLAYDGSPKGREALYVAAYLATQWKLELAVLSVGESETVTMQTLDDARQYLESHALQAAYRYESGNPGEAIVNVSQESPYDLIIMGGYGYHPMLEVFLGSSVDHVLRASCIPVLICR